MKKVKPADISTNPGRLLDIKTEDIIPLPYPFDHFNSEPAIKELTEEQQNKYECSFDGISAIGLIKPDACDHERLIGNFINGYKKLLSKNDNWTFVKPLLLSLEYCAKCQLCSEECPVYMGSGRQDIYRPSFRAEVLRKIKGKYIDPGGKTFAKFTGNEIDLNWTAISRLAESAYRCTICRRCTQACARGIDNGLITHELRKLFSQEMGIVPKELHSLGSVKQLQVGASTGINPKAFAGMIQFMENDIEERTGKKLKIPVDKEGADILLLHNSGEFISWPENPEAFAIMFNEAGIDWTLSSDLAGYEGTNYGVWYDDVQFARIALRQVEAARKLKVNRIVLGECGHAHKALTVIAERVLIGDMKIPRESCLPILEDIVCKGKIKLDPSRNDFPVTLHDPCNMVRLMGIVEPQRRILRQICPEFIEMEPHGVNNYCCGGGSGFAIISNLNFPSWRSSISGRMKLKQILTTFQNNIDPGIRKYVCAPCSNCKGQFRDMFDYYGVWDKCTIMYGGLAELIVNAMSDLKKPFINWEWR